MSLATKSIDSSVPITPIDPHSDEFVGPEELEQLHHQLEDLQTHHHAVLAQESALDDVSKLQRWISECQDGSARAERKLYTRGMELLANVKSKLALAMEEQQRIIEESPMAAATAKGRDAERYAKASSQANDALTKLGEITGQTAETSPVHK